MSVMTQKKSILYDELIFLIAYMPFHYYICELLIDKTSLDNIFRDIVIIVMTLIVMAHMCQLKVKSNGFLIIVIAFVSTIVAMVSVFMYGYPQTFNILRTYLVPMLIYFVASSINMTGEMLNKIHKLIAIEMSLIAAYGFFQAFILGDDFLVRIGYPGGNGHLSSASFYISGFFGFQRVTGTFVSPNICGTIFAIGMCVYLCSKEMRFKHKIILMVILLVGLLTTFSRSSILSFALATLFYLFITGHFGKYKFNKIRRYRELLIVFVCVVQMLILDSIFLDSLFKRMFTSSFMSILSGMDPSAKKHILDLKEPIEEIVNHPLGLGFGNNGPMAVGYTSTARNVESSFYLMMYEMGPILGLIYFIPYFRVVVNTVINKRYKYYLPAVVNIVVLGTYLLLPNVQTYEIIFYAFLFIGLYDNVSVKKIYY